jgi:hypothetical protein
MMANADALADVPTDETFFLSELNSDEAKTLVKRLKTTEALNVSEVSEDGIIISKYELSRAAIERREAILEDRYSPLPCDHGGLRTLSEGFECCWDPCDETFSRSEVEDV